MGVSSPRQPSGQDTISLDPRRSRASCEDAGWHYACPGLAVTEMVAGSSPAAGAECPIWPAETLVRGVSGSGPVGALSRREIVRAAGLFSACRSALEQQGHPPSGGPDLVGTRAA